MVFAKVRGSFTKWSGAVQTDDSGALVGLSAEVEIDSIDTREAQRDGHLKSPDFFDAAAHHTMRFTSTAIGGDTSGAFTITGELSIRGTTRPVTLQAKATGAGKDPWGNQRRGFRAAEQLAGGLDARTSPQGPFLQRDGHQPLAPVLHLDGSVGRRRRRAAARRRAAIDGRAGAQREQQARCRGGAGGEGQARTLLHCRKSSIAVHASRHAGPT
jgi:hypothetical protein